MRGGTVSMDCLQPILSLKQWHEREISRVRSLQVKVANFILQTVDEIIDNIGDNTRALMDEIRVSCMLCLE